MTAKNDITGDSIQTKIANENYLNNFDDVFMRDYFVVYRTEKEIKTATVSASSVVNARKRFLGMFGSVVTIIEIK